MDTEELKPCPFCGSRWQIIRETAHPDTPWEVFCKGSQGRACDAAMWGETSGRAIEEWNRRAPDLAAEVIHLRELAEAVARENERCAVIADFVADNYPRLAAEHNENAKVIAKECAVAARHIAAAIRATTPDAG